MSASDPARPQLAYKVLTAAQLTALETGSFAGAPIDLADGYIHLSTQDQLTGTVDKHFAGQAELSIAAVDLAAYANDAIRWETSRDGQAFPHLYAPLLLETVVAYGPLQRDETGQVRLPIAG